MKRLTDKQIAALKNIGITNMPQTRTAAQAIIRQHTMSKSKRGKNGRLANRESRRHDQRLDGVTITFVCPICGDGHNRENHPS
jgi:hypothetical protein